MTERLKIVVIVSSSIHTWNENISLLLCHINGVKDSFLHSINDFRCTGVSGNASSMSVYAALSFALWLVDETLTLCLPTHQEKVQCYSQLLPRLTHTSHEFHEIFSRYLSCFRLVIVQFWEERQDATVSEKCSLLSDLKHLASRVRSFLMLQRHLTAMKR